MHRTSVTTLALVALTASAAARSVDGHYTLIGRNADGSAYEGTVDIAVTTAGGCRIVWHIVDATQEGDCEQEADTLSATYTLEGQRGNAVYRIRPDGGLEGEWRIDGEARTGTERLTPVKAAAAQERPQTAVDFVRSFYESDPIYNPGFDKPFEARLTGPALAAVRKSDKESAASGEIGCIDFVLSLNAQDSDEPTVRRTLKLTEVGAGKAGRATIDASFVNFELEGIPADQQTRTVVEYDLQQVGDAWRVSDISAKAVDDQSFGWRLSELCR